MNHRVTTLILAAAALLVAGAAFAVPRSLQYQGRLTDAAGVPLTDPVNVTFSIYTVPSAGEALWDQTFEGLSLDNGRFNVLLGGEEAPFTPDLIAELRDGAELYLGIRVEEDPEMSPRQQIASVLYGLHSEFADTAATVPGMPGIAYNAVARTTVPISSTLTVVSVTVTTSAPGFLLVSASGTLVLDNSFGIGARCEANIGETLNANPELSMGFIVADVNPFDAESKHYVPFHCQRVYEKPAGTFTFHLNVRNYSPDGKVVADYPSITATFLPNSLGPAPPEEPEPAPGSN